MDGSALRRQALDHVRAYTEGTADAGGLQRILLEGGWDGKSCPSGDMCHWLMWELGCRDSRILSRDVPELRISREAGLVQKLHRGAQRLAAWTSFRLENWPEPGDLVLSGSQKKGEREISRVFCATDSLTRIWTLVEARVSLEGILSVVEVRGEVKGEDLVVDGRKEELAGWVDLAQALCEL